MKTTKNSKKSCCRSFLDTIHVIWDGLGFFGTASHKLDRLRGIKPNWYDRFMDKTWLLLKGLITVILVAVLISHKGMIGTPKSQEVNHARIESANFTV